MKTSQLPPLRVSPEVRAQAESVLAPGESLSSIVRDAVTRTIEFRNSQQQFVARGLASATKARGPGRYVSSKSAPATLRRQIDRSRSHKKA